MKKNLDDLLEYCSRVGATAHCPYGEERLRQLATVAISRSEAERLPLAGRRVSLGRTLARYAAAACVALLLGCGAYATVSAQEPAMQASVPTDCQYVVGTVTYLINQQWSA